MKVLASLCLLALLLATGCYRHVTTERQVESSSFIALPSLQADAIVEIARADGSHTTVPVTRGGNLRIAVPAGTHRVTVRRGDQVVADRVVFVGPGESKDLDVR